MLAAHDPHVTRQRRAHNRAHHQRRHHDRPSFFSCANLHITVFESQFLPIERSPYWLPLSAGLACKSTATESICRLPASRWDTPRSSRPLDCADTARKSVACNCSTAISKAHRFLSVAKSSPTDRRKIAACPRRYLQTPTD